MQKHTTFAAIPHVTDALSPDLRTVAMTIIGFYFVTALVR
jgi:hypothetical protein